MVEELNALTFAEALPRWLKLRKPSIHPNTFRYYEQYADVLLDWFGPFQCSNIGLGEVRGFQHWRSYLCDEPATGELPLESILFTSKYRHNAGNVRIRNEINGVLKPFLKELGLWDEIKKRGFRHLPVPKGEGAGVALDRKEQAIVLEVAFSRPKWLLTAHCLRIMYRTGTGPGEITKPKRRDVDLVKGTLRIIEGAKNDRRDRLVMLIPSARESAEWLVRRWEHLGGWHPDDYLLPHRSMLKKGVTRFTRPQTSIYRSWRAIKNEVILRHPDMKEKLLETRLYDCRVSAASLLLENENISLAVIEKVLGWSPNSKMRERYHRKAMEERRQVLQTLEEAG